MVDSVEEFLTDVTEESRETLQLETSMLLMPPKMVQRSCLQRLARFGKRTTILRCNLRPNSTPVFRLRSFAPIYSALTFWARSIVD